MDEAAIEAQGAKPLEARARPDRANREPRRPPDRSRAPPDLEGVNAVFQFGSEQDRKKSTDVIATAVQGGLGLPDRDYYTKTDEASQQVARAVRRRT